MITREAAVRYHTAGIPSGIPSMENQKRPPFRESVLTYTENVKRERKQQNAERMESYADGSKIEFSGGLLQRGAQPTERKGRGSS